ncbi:conserved hypothetical protein [groundwater metagenome]|uniref:IS1 transposase n=1 Tax=groundwater metagenome TaxID=717931 RepID=A0A098E831_9ZZZZ
MKCTHISVQKKICWIWIAVDRNGHKFINCEIGTRGTETGVLLWKKIEKKINEKNGKVCTDYWGPYESFVPKEKHIQQDVRELPKMNPCYCDNI